MLPKLEFKLLLPSASDFSLFYYLFISTDLSKVLKLSARPQQEVLTIQRLPRLATLRSDQEDEPLQAAAYLVLLWLALSLLQCFVLGINEVNHLITAIHTIDEKKNNHNRKPLKILTFIHNISLSTGLPLTRNVLFVECFLLVLDVCYCILELLFHICL